MYLVKLLTAEAQSNIKIYDLISSFYQLLFNKEWLKKYIYWELEFLSTLGYKLDLNSMVNKKIHDNKIIYTVETITEKKIVPNFLINKDEKVEELDVLIDGLKLVGDYMDKTILKPNNINFPNTRKQFLQSLK